MTITPLALTNPGAEAGSTAGWVSRSGGLPGVSTSPGGAAPHAGTYAFIASPSGATAKWDQEIDVSAIATEIDAGTAAIRFEGWHKTWPSDDDTGALYVETYDNGHALLDSHQNAQTEPDVWTFEEIRHVLPVNTRFVRFGTTNVRVQGTECSSYWDDFAAEVSDDWPSDYGEDLAPRAQQFGVLAIAAQNSDLGDADVQVRASQFAAYAIAFRPAQQLFANQYGANLLAAQNSVEGDADVQVQLRQIGVYAIVRGRPDTRRARAWTFPQDDHDLYVLQAGNEYTLILDLLSNQWSRWKSDGKPIWRASKGLDWDTDNVGGDVSQGILWNINPNVRDDDSITGLANERVPIQSTIRGLYSIRLRDALNCARATLTVSQGSPVAAGVGIKLRTSDDFGKTWLDHGFLVTDQIREYDLSWYSMGLISAPGRIFEITDTGYAQRIDGLDIDLGDGEEGSQRG